MGIPDPIKDAQFYAGVPVRRLTAFGADLAAIVAIWLLVLVLGSILVVLTAGLAAPLAFLGFAATGFLYRWLFLCQRSATPGMRVTGIEVRDASGAPLSPSLAFLHTAGFYVTLFFPPLLIISWLLLLGSAHRRALHDLPLGTVVINRPN